MVINNLGMQGYGIDPSNDAVKVGRKSGLRVNLGILEKTDYPDNYFDMITAHNVIEHVHNPIRGMNELRRILKPGGYIIMYTPNTDSLSFKLTKEKWAHLGAPQHLNLFSPKNLKLLASKSGFKFIKMRYITEPRCFVFQSYLWFCKIAGIKNMPLTKLKRYTNQFSWLFLLPISWIIDSMKKSDAMEIYLKKE